ncbi:MAG: methylenetetrahydrofolate reductase, partial [Actinomycetota bacterium]
MSAEVESLPTDARRAIAAWLEDPIFELIPLPGVMDQARHLPSGARVSITASPTRSLDESIDLAGELIAAGFRTTPHLSAAMVRDGAHLQRLLTRMSDIGVTSAFVVGGDGEPTGPFGDGLALLKEMEAVGHSLELGIPCYPEGHPQISEDVLEDALLSKRPYASWMTSQMCFDASSLSEWTQATRRRGVDLPLVLGMAGVADRLKLMQISARIGVGRSLAFLRKNAGLVSAFVKPGGYDPGEFLMDLGELSVHQRLDVAGCHIYTFNQCETTEEWR